MKNIILLFFVLGLLCFSHSSNAQRCKTNEIRQKNIKNNPSILESINHINQFTEDWIRNNASNIHDRSTVILPVVVHIIWRTNEENISDAQIQSQMDVLNEDFRKLNANFSSTPPPFQVIGADIEVEFCLASIDPDGNPTNGITRTQTDTDNIGETEDWFDDAFGGKSPWDNTQYINIWVCDIGDDGTLGFATPPGTADPAESDGLVIGHQFFGKIGTAANSVPNHLGRTTTHEMGHYLNLEHVWGPGNGGCNEDDFVTDTPSQFTESGGCPSFPHFDNCTSSGDGIMYNNYMDYADDDCMTMFTEGQKMRMLAALNGPRSGLLDSQGCSDMTSTRQLESSFTQLDIFPNPSNGNIIISLNGESENQTIHVTDLFGQQLMSFQVRKNKALDLSILPSGIYLVFCENQPHLSQKIIISK